MANSQLSSDDRLSGTHKFRCVNGHLHLPALQAALDQTVAAVTPAKEDAA